MVEKVRVGARGQLVIPKKLREKLNIEHGDILEIREVEGGILLKPYSPVARMRGLGKGVFGDPIQYQRRIRTEWEEESR